MGESKSIVIEQSDHPASTWIGTSNRGYGITAVEELRRKYKGMRAVPLSAGDVFRFDIELPPAEVLQRIAGDEPIFLRHLFPVHAIVPSDGSQDDLERIRAAVRNGGWQLEGNTVAVQARKAEGVSFAYSPFDVKMAVDEVLQAQYRAHPVIQEMDTVVSVFLAEGNIYIGCSKPEQNLSSWSGGAIHFRKDQTDISRAKFKLMEAEQVFGLSFKDGGRALDIGAAPGGWSSLLLERGMHVTAVDPAKMDSALLRNPRLTHLQRNAADIHFPDKSFDVMVCDMSWDPIRMARMLKELTAALVVGGMAVTTVKLMHGKPFATVREMEHILSPEWKLRKTKQLFHNREELTCLWSRR